MQDIKLDLKFLRAVSLTGHMTASLTRLCGAALRTDRLTEGYWPVGAGGGRCTTYMKDKAGPAPWLFFFFNFV